VGADPRGFGRRQLAVRFQQQIAIREMALFTVHTSPSGGAVDSRQRSSQGDGNRADRKVEDLGNFPVSETLGSQVKAAAIDRWKSVQDSRKSFAGLGVSYLIFGVEAGVYRQIFHQSERRSHSLPVPPIVTPFPQRQIVRNAKQPTF
jgi:hypothetical protein